MIQPLTCIMENFLSTVCFLFEYLPFVAIGLLCVLALPARAQDGNERLLNECQSGFAGIKTVCVAQMIGSIIGKCSNRVLSLT